MCREMIRLSHEGSLVVNGADVLELGAGCGVAGFLCAKLGAKRVTFTDYLPGLLANLDASVALQAEDKDTNEDEEAPLAVVVKVRVSRAPPGVARERPWFVRRVGL
jgi:predicted nicotinamide N-methyase